MIEAAQASLWLALAALVIEWTRQLQRRPKKKKKRRARRNSAKRK